MFRRFAAAMLVALTLAVTLGPSHVGAQTTQSDEIIRRAKSKVQPAYPELARKMNLSGTVKVEVIVAPNGTVKEARVVGDIQYWRVLRSTPPRNGVLIQRRRRARESSTSSLSRGSWTDSRRRRA